MKLDLNPMPLAFLSEAHGEVVVYTAYLRPEYKIPFGSQPDLASLNLWVGAPVEVHAVTTMPAKAIGERWAAVFWSN